MGGPGRVHQRLPGVGIDQTGVHRHVWLDLVNHFGRLVEGDPGCAAQVPEQLVAVGAIELQRPQGRPRHGVEPVQESQRAMLQRGLASRPVHRASGVSRAVDPDDDGPGGDRWVEDNRAIGGHVTTLDRVEGCRNGPESSLHRDQGPCWQRACAVEDQVMSTSATALPPAPLRPGSALPGPADVVLADGRLGVIRRLAPSDGAALHALHDQISDDALRMRFFNVSRAAAHDYVEHVLADPGTLALVAEMGGRLVALATAEPTSPDTSEVAFLVADDHHGQGLGTLLLEHLFALARDRGIRRIEAEVLVENHAMLRVLADAGFELTQYPDRGVVMVNLHTAGNPKVQDAADRREFSAESRSLAPLLAPRSVAVAGVRSDGTGVGAAVLRSIVETGYVGSVVVVHPRRNSVAGVRAYPLVRRPSKSRGPGGDRGSGRGFRERSRGRGRRRCPRGRGDQLGVR